METNNVNQITNDSPSLEGSRKFTGVETIFAWCCLLAGYFFCKIIPLVSSPLAAMVFSITLFIVTIIVLNTKKMTAKLPAYIVAGTAIAMSVAIIFTSNNYIQFFAYAYCLLSYGYLVYTAFGNSTEKGFSDLILIDFFKILFVMPFVSLVQIFPALFYSQDKKRGKMVAKILLGIAIAVVPTAVIIGLLSYDSNFSGIIEKIFSDIDFFEELICIIFGVPVGMFAYGIFISSADGKCKNVITAEGCRNVSGKIKKAPISTILAATLPILAVYVIFFISQWEYYVSGFKGVLPEKTIYADYAREGFFQLCAVSVINFVILIIISLFMKRKQEKPTIIQKIITIVFSVFTLILIATAISKMFMYINVYGLTPKRVYSTWLMLVLALVFFVLILKQFVQKIKSVAISVVIVIVAFAALAFSNVDGIIARYNVDRYIAGSNVKPDVDTLYEMGESAIPAMVKLAKHYDQKNGTDFTEFYQRNQDSYFNNDNTTYRKLCNKLFKLAEERNKTTSLWAMTLPGIKADKALKECGLAEKIASVDKNLEIIAKVAASYYQEHHKEKTKIFLSLYESEISCSGENLSLTQEERESLNYLRNNYPIQYKYADVGEGYVVFWTNTIREEGILMSENPKKTMKELRENDSALEFEKINDNWYEIKEWWEYF